MALGSWDALFLISGLPLRFYSGLWMVAALDTTMTKRIDGLENAVTESTKATAATLTARPNPAMPPQPDARGNDGPTNITALGPTFNLKKGGPGPTKTVTNPMNARQQPGVGGVIFTVPSDYEWDRTSGA
ncbi:hypothetical protein B0H14DRAFT_3437007 [Mycena olivaceomarginata]|nr:hypothetical protein B0H14DRAFT_3437007 [Mycena olivaceomarginata]